MGSAGGGYTRQALAMGYNDKQADLFGAIMGSMEGATEAVGGALTTNVGKKFASKELQAGLGALGLDVTENFLEEAIMEPIQELTKQSIGKNGDWKDITKRMLRSGLDGALTSIIMGGVSAGVGSAVKVATKAQNNEVISQEEIKQALQDINKSEEVDIEKLLVDSFNFQSQDLMQVTEAQQRKDDRLEKVAQDISQSEGLKIRYANLDDDRISQIENSELSENQINKLLDISNKYDLSQKDIQDLIDNTKNGKYEQNQATTTPNNEILNQEQQTIQQEGKQAQNETLKQIEKNAQNKGKKYNETYSIDKNSYKNEAKQNTIRLYTNTKAENIDSILKDGLKIDKAKQKEYEGNMTWFETRPDLKGYGGTTIAVDVPVNLKMEKLNDTQYGVYEDISPENIVFIDKPIFNNYRTSDLENLVNKFGKDKVLEVFNKSKSQSITRAELEDMISNIEEGKQAQNELSEQQEENKREVIKKQEKIDTPTNRVNQKINELAEKVKNNKEILNNNIEKINNQLKNQELSYSQKQELYNVLDENEKQLQQMEDLEDKYNLKSYYEVAEEKSQDKGQYAKVDTEQQAEQPVEQTVKEEKINLLPSKKVESEQTKQRKHYESIMKSSETSKEAKSIAKKLLGTDTYVPDSNKAQLERADQRIGANPDNELNVLTSKIDNGDRLNATDIAVSERLIEYYSKIGDLEKLETAIQNTALAGTQLGQSVQALSLINRQTPVGQVTYIERTIKKLNQEILNNKGYTQNSEGKILNKKGEDVTDKVELFDFTSEMQQKILNSNKDNIDKVLDEVYDELGNQVTKSTHQKIDSWRYFSMLANIRTHLRNIVGNFAMGKTQQVKNLISAGVEDVSGIINPKFERTKTLRRSDKITKEFAKNDIKNVASELGLNSNKYTAQNRLKDNMREFKSNTLNSTLGKLYNLNNTLLEVEDGWGLKSAYVRAFSNYITANKLDVKNISDTNLRKARKYAINEAQEATFHQASALASAINQFSARSKVGKAITDSNLPFVKTPINVAKTGLEYNPAGLVYNSVKGIHDLNTGKITVNQYIDNISKGLTGTGISLLGYALAEAGIVKASGGDDDKEKYEKDRGSQAYSIKIGDNTYSLDWLAPVGIPFFVGVEAHEIINEKKKQKTAKSTDDDSLYKQGIQSATNILNAFATSMNPMAEMSMLSGLTSALRSFDQGVGMIGSLIANAGQSYINQFEPTLLKQVARVTDSKQRTTKSTATGTLGKAVDQTKNQIMAGIPGLRQKLPVATDIWGEELENDDNITRRAFETFIAPYTRKDLKTSRLDSELNDLYDKTGETSIYPSKLKKDLTIDNETYKFTNEEYIKYSKDYGQNSYNILSNLVTSNDYQNLSDSDKQKAIEKAYEYAKEVNKVNYAKKINKEDTVETDALYNVMSNIPSDSEKGKYLVYLVETSGDDVKDTEKKSYLLNSNMKDSTKEVIYRNSLGKKDKLYNTLYDIDKVNINGYLDYSSRDIKSDPDEESNVEGDTIYGTKKINVANALNEISNLSLFDKLYIYGKSYKLDSNERKIVDNGIKNSNLTQEEKDEAYKDLSKSNIIKYKDGSYKWK